MIYTLDNPFQEKSFPYKPREETKPRQLFSEQAVRNVLDDIDNEESIITEIKNL